MHGRDHTETLGSALSEKNGGAHFDVFRSVHKVKLDETLVSRAEEVPVHLEDLGSLPDHPAMYHRLIVMLDGRRMMQDNDLGIEIVGALRARLFVKQDHTLPEMRSLHLELLGI